METQTSPTKVNTEEIQAGYSRLNPDMAQGVQTEASRLNHDVHIGIQTDLEEPDTAVPIFDQQTQTELRID